MKVHLSILIVVLTISVSENASGNVNVYQHQRGNSVTTDKWYTALADSVAPDSSGMDTLSSGDFSQRLVPGWNIGNSLDAMPGETSWGNPAVTQQLIDSIKAAGFRSVRIPIAWSSHFTDTSTYTIDSTWMVRVEQVIDYVLKDSMYAIINEHWDGGWMQPTHADSAYVNHRLAVMWKQIAIHFRDFDDHLLFAGMNEVMVTNNYNTPTLEYYTVQNSFNQTFVTVVRSTGGRNVYRYLLVQGFNTNIDYTYDFFTMPVDVTLLRLMVEVHYYDPYDFTLSTSNTITEWGMYAKDPSKTETWANESYADGQFQKMETRFIDNGYGVVLGEYGAIARLNLGSTSLNSEYANFRRYYMQYITRSLERHGLVPVFWDNGYTGDAGMGIFNRSTGAQAYPDIIDAIIDTGRVDPILGVNQSPLLPNRIYLRQNYPNPFNPSTEISYQLSEMSQVRLTIYDLLGRRVSSLVDEKQLPGSYTVKWDASNLATGVYFYRLMAQGTNEAKKMVLAK